MWQGAWLSGWRRMNRKQTSLATSIIHYSRHLQSRKACFQNSCTPLCHRLISESFYVSGLEVGCLPPAAWPTIVTVPWCHLKRIPHGVQHTFKRQYLFLQEGPSSPGKSYIRRIRKTSLKQLSHYPVPQPQKLPQKIQGHIWHLCTPGFKYSNLTDIPLCLGNTMEAGR